MASVLILTAASCSKDEKKSPPSEPSVQRRNTVGSSQNIGIFPDGTKAQPLTEQDLKDIGEMVKGVSTVNGAIGVLTADESKDSNDKKRISRSSELSSLAVDALQAIQSAPVIGKLIRSPDLFMKELVAQIENNGETAPEDPLYSEVRTECKLDSKEDMKREEGENSFSMTGTSMQTFTGDRCPIKHEVLMGVDIQGSKLNNNFAKFTARLNLVVDSALSSNEKKNKYDFDSQSFNVGVEGEMIASSKKTELAGSLKANGRLKTTTHGQLDIKALSDVYMKSVGEKVQALDVSASFVVDTQGPDLLIQVQFKLAGDGQKPLLKIYLNGVELKANQDEQKK